MQNLARAKARPAIRAYPGTLRATLYCYFGPIFANDSIAAHMGDDFGIWLSHVLDWCNEEYVMVSRC